VEIGDEDAPFVTEPIEDPFEVGEPEKAEPQPQPVKRPEPTPVREPVKVPA